MSASASRTRGVYSMFGNAAQEAMSDQGPPHASSSSSTYNALDDWTAAAGPEKTLDLVFIMDATGSMGSYIASATKNIEAICEHRALKIIHSEKLSGRDALRLGLLAYRDHPPQDHTYIVKNFGFTTKVAEMKENLKSLYASGGGDGPEAVTAALKAATELDWRPSATRMAVLIADAPPHGIGEYGDGFPNGSPDEADPLQIARQMATAGIPLFMIACEPGLSGYLFATDFFQALVRITGSQLLPLTSASLLAHVIIGAAGEAMDLDRLHREVGDAVVDRLRSMSLEGQAAGAGPGDVMDEVTKELHQSLSLRNEETKQLLIENIYKESEESKHNIDVWLNAPNIAAARPHLKKVIGSRLSDRYRQTRNVSYSDYPHPRMSKATGIVATDVYAASHAAVPSSPDHGQRKVVSDFNTFSAGPGMSFSGAGSPPAQDRNSSTFSSPRATSRDRVRHSMMDDDDNDSDEEDARPAKPLPVEVTEDGTMEIKGDDGQILAYRQGAISMEQVRRLAIQSAYRGGLAA
ncbi:hypothetical protein FA10DRAFT_259323 [Acaromyces ingoldii]|uniref:VWFA domain-containing protein n=1 Tax=Acaromyces ingoldii TaxID=215250 RepID=A0A316YTF9_9BASI|nr:hypothetical protein FA10DRAFT_259323 [Acaromyces ingoldii]PWN92064.1 hypothetical protein FA10DRAFT_259323 [Acaromyces ingoldii]